MQTTECLTIEDKRVISAIMKKARRKSSSKKAIVTFGDISGDVHLIHRDEVFARNSGLQLEGPIDMGARLSAVGLEAEREVETYFAEKRGEKPRQLASHQSSFSDKSYPRKGPSWVHAGYLNTDEEDTEKLFGQRKGIKVIENVARFGAPSPLGDPPKNPLHSIPIQVNPLGTSMQKYLKLMKLDIFPEIIPHGLIQAYTPGALTRILQEVYPDPFGMPAPINRSMKTEFYDAVEIKPFDVIVYITGERGDERGKSYSFEGHLISDGKLKAITRLKAFSPRPLNMDGIRRVSGLEYTLA